MTYGSISTLEEKIMSSSCLPECCCTCDNLFTVAHQKSGVVRYSCSTNHALPVESGKCRYQRDVGTPTDGPFLTPSEISRNLERFR